MLFLLDTNVNMGTHPAFRKPLQDSVPHQFKRVSAYANNEKNLV